MRTNPYRPPTKLPWCVWWFLVSTLLLWRAASGSWQKYRMPGRMPPPFRLSRIPPLQGRYGSVANTTIATKNKKNRAIAPRNIAPTTANALGLNLNIDLRATFASSGRCGS